MVNKVPVGGVVFSDKPIELNANLPSVKIKVRNTGDRPIQVGSHFHFFEVNRALEFDRATAFGKRLDIIAGSGIRFEPGDEKEVFLVPFAGIQRVHGFNNLVEGWVGGLHQTYHPDRKIAMMRMKRLGFLSTGECCSDHSGHHGKEDKCCN